MAGLPLTSELGFVLRLDMVVELPVELGATPLPEGLEFAPLDPRKALQLAALEHAAFLGTADAVAFADQLASTELALANLRPSLAQRRFHRRASFGLHTEDGALVGYVVVTRGQPGVAQVTSLGVDPAWKGQGLGRALVVAAMEAAGDEGDAEMFLTVSAHNGPALGLYESLGFITVGAEVHVFRRTS